MSRLLGSWRTLGLLFEDGGQIVHVVPYAANQDLMRWVTREGSSALVPALFHGPVGRTPDTGAATTLRCWRERDEEARERAGMCLERPGTGTLLYGPCRTCLRGAPGMSASPGP